MKKHTVQISAALLLSVFGSISSVSAAIIPFSATMDCAAANGGAGTCALGGTGTGTTSATLDDSTNLFSWTVEWSGLSAPVSAAHFHGPATVSQSAGVAVGIDHTSNPSVGSATITSAQAAELLAGLWYMNVHSEGQFSGGEIRGQLSIVPVPAAVWLFGSALGLLGWLRRSTT